MIAAMGSGGKNFDEFDPLLATLCEDFPSEFELDEKGNLIAKRLPAGEVFCDVPDLIATKKAAVHQDKHERVGVAAEVIMVKSDAPVLAPGPVAKAACDEHLTISSVSASAFPFDEDAYLRHCGNFVHHSDAGLKAAVKSLSEGVHPDGTDGHSYFELRELFLGASTELNKRGSIAPYYLARMPPKFPVPPEQENYACDLQVIDLHWLSCHGNPLPTDEWKNIFLPSGLNFSRAWEFSRKKVRHSYKAKFLGLGGIELHCISMSASEEIKALRKKLYEQRGSVIAKIKRAMESPNSRRSDDPNYLYDVFRSLRLMDGCKTSARNLIALMGHSKPEKTKFIRQAKWLENISLI